MTEKEKLDAYVPIEIYEPGGLIYQFWMQTSKDNQVITEKLSKG